MELGNVDGGCLVLSNPGHKRRPYAIPRSRWNRHRSRPDRCRCLLEEEDRTCQEEGRPPPPLSPQLLSLITRCFGKVSQRPTRSAVFYFTNYKGLTLVYKM